MDAEEESRREAALAEARAIARAQQEHAGGKGRGRGFAAGAEGGGDDWLDGVGAQRGPGKGGKKGKAKKGGGKKAGKKKPPQQQLQRPRDAGSVEVATAVESVTEEPKGSEPGAAGDDATGGVGDPVGEGAPEEDEPPEECAICIVVLEPEADELGVLVCRHRFHADCLDLWAGRCRAKDIEATCPYCRAPMEYMV
jgi:hypothetical protein